MNIIFRENKKESNLFNNSDLISTHATINPATIEQATEKECHNDTPAQAAPQPEAIIHTLKPHKPRLSTKTANKRKKPTTAQKKQVKVNSCGSNNMRMPSHGIYPIITP